MRRSVLDALFSTTKQEVLAACLLHPTRWWYLSDLAKHLGKSPSTLQRDLAALTAADILESRKDGNRAYYKANIQSPILPELQSLLIKTAGIKEVLAEALKTYLRKADTAFIYGSLARGEEISSSDIDVMIIGDVKLSEIAPALKRIEKKLGRDVNPTVYTSKEFAQKTRAENSFLKTVINDKKLFIKGSDSELQTLVG